MELKIFLCGELIGSIPINLLRLYSPDYITYLKYELVQRNEDLLSYCTEEPEFVIHSVAYNMDSFKSKLEKYWLHS